MGNEKTGIEDAVDRAIDEMPDNFAIKGFLLANRAEVKNMCLTEYDEGEVMQMFWEDGREEGLEEGREEGLKEGQEMGRIEGLREGREEGQKEGREKGLAEGESKGEDKLARLMKALFAAGRSSDAERAVTDDEARLGFYQEFGIA